MPKKYLVFLITAFLALSYCNNASALEVLGNKYPSLPPFSVSITPSSTLPDYIAYFFILGIYIAGLAALIALAIGAIQLMTSAGNPSARGDALDRIKSAILGLLLLMASVIILKTINPQLATITLTKPNGVLGVFYVKGDETMTAPEEEGNISVNTPTGYNEIWYKCSDKGPGTGPTLLIWEFPQPYFKGTDDNYSGAVVVRKNCGERETIRGLGSFKMDFERPGIYYFLGKGCSMYGSAAKVSDEKEIEQPFKGKIASIRVVNDEANDLYFGAIGHSNAYFRGQCILPFEDFDVAEDCKNIDISLFSINIFNWNPQKGSSGDGVTFYSKPFGYKTGEKAGYIKIPDSKIDPWASIYKGVSTEQLKFSYAGIEGVKEEEQKLCQTFFDCPGSAKIDGRYLIEFFSRKKESSDKEYSFCQVFNQDVSNLKAEEVSAEGRELKGVNIIPIK